MTARIVGQTRLAGKGKKVMSAQDAATEIVDEFSFFDDWADRYQHLIDQGRRLEAIRQEWRTDDHKLKGCQSIVYFGAELDADGFVRFSAESDAAIVQGLIALLLRVYSGRTPQDILATDAGFLAEIGLDKHLSATRKNGIASMLASIKSVAKTYAI